MPASKSGLSKSRPELEDDDVWAPPPPAAPAKSKEPPTGEATRLARKHHLDLYEVKFILKLFMEADDNNSGGLDKQEFEGVIRKLFEVPKNESVPATMLNDAWGKMMSKAEGGGAVEANADTFLEWYTANMFTAMVREVDDRGGGNLSYELAKQYGTDIITIDKIRKRFDSFDLDGSGKIDYEEFFKMLMYVLKATSPEDVSDDRAQRFWSEIDEDGSGEIDFPEFVAWFVKYFNPDDQDMDLSKKGPVSQFYASFNPMAKSSSMKSVK